MPLENQIFLSKKKRKRKKEISWPHLYEESEAPVIVFSYHALKGNIYFLVVIYHLPSVIGKYVSHVNDVGK